MAAAVAKAPVISSGDIGEWQLAGGVRASMLLVGKGGYMPAFINIIVVKVILRGMKKSIIEFNLYLLD